MYFKEIDSKGTPFSTYAFLEDCLMSSKSTDQLTKRWNWVCELRCMYRIVDRVTLEELRGAALIKCNLLMRETV